MYAGDTILHSGALTLEAGGRIKTEQGVMEAGYFSGDSVHMTASGMALDQTAIQTYFDKVQLVSSDALSLKNVSLSARYDALLESLSLELRNSSIRGNAASVQIQTQKAAVISTANLQSSTQTTVRGGSIDASGVAVVSGTETLFSAHDAMAMRDSTIKAQQAALLGNNVSVKNLSSNAPTSLAARNKLSVDGLKSTDDCLVSKKTVNLQGTYRNKKAYRSSGKWSQ